MELTQGDRSRSGGQYDIWRAVFSPVGPDGYPKPIFDKVTGVIDSGVAAYWREHFDLVHIIARDWAMLAPKLQGKIHLYVGNGDNYYLTDSVYFGQETLESLQPPYRGTVAYGDRAEHCWNGDPKAANAKMHQMNPSMDADTFAEVAEVQKPFIEGTPKGELGTMTNARWETLIGQLKDLGYIPAAIPAEACFRLL